MDIKIPAYVLTADTKEAQLKEISPENNEKAKGGYGGKEISLKKSYHNISRNGDTVELSEKGQKLHRQTYQP